MAPEPKILLGRQGEQKRVVAAPGRAWGWVFWFALALTVVGIGDWIIAWIPARFGSPEWEFGTVVSSFSGLPLVTMGFAGLLASAVARGIRSQIILIAAMVLLFDVLILGAAIVFLLDVPIALASVEGVARLGIMKAIAKTTLLGTVFIATYTVAGIGALRHARSGRSDA